MLKKKLQTVVGLMSVSLLLLIPQGGVAFPLQFTSAASRYVVNFDATGAGNPPYDLAATAISGVNGGFEFDFMWFDGLNASGLVQASGHAIGITSDVFPQPASHPLYDDGIFSLLMQWTSGEGDLGGIQLILSDVAGVRVIIIDVPGTESAAVPLPGTLTLLAVGLLGVGVSRRKLAE